MGLIILMLVILYSVSLCLTWGRIQSWLHRILAVELFFFVLTTDIQLAHVIAVTPPSPLEFISFMGIVFVTILGGVLVVGQVMKAAEMDSAQPVQKNLPLAFYDPPTKLCNECGKSIPIDSRFCNYCSAPTNTSAGKQTSKLN